MEALSSLISNLLSKADDVLYSRLPQQDVDQEELTPPNTFLASTLRSIIPYKGTPFRKRTQQSPFVNLPLEVKYAIFAYLNLDITIVEKPNTRPIANRLCCSQRRYHSMSTEVDHWVAPLAQVCSQLRSEVISYPGKRFYYEAPRDSPPRTYTGGLSWIHYETITHIQIPEAYLGELARLRLVCQNLKCVIVRMHDVDYKREQMLHIIKRLRQSYQQYMADPGHTDPQKAVEYALSKVLVPQANFPASFGVRTSVPRLGLDPTRKFRLLLRYYTAGSFALRKLDWDTGEVEYETEM